MDTNYGFNGNLQYPSLDLTNQFHSDNTLPNINLNIFSNNMNMNDNNNNNNDNNNQNQNQISSKNKLYNIKGTTTDIYIENTNKNLTIKIPKSFNNNMSIVKNKYEYINTNYIESYPADSIIGIFVIDNNKYLGIVTSSKVAGKVLGSFLFNITSIELIKITINNETPNEINIKKEIKNLFLTKNFYYSNDFDLSLSLYDQYKINSYDYDGKNSNKKQLKSKYLINSTLLKDFVDSNIPECFYSTVIYGYIGCKIDVDLDENKKYLTADIIIIERYYKKNIIFNSDIPEHVKQIELICTFKNKSNNNKTKNTFSFIFYISSESMKNINQFEPCKDILSEEFEKYKNITCIINNINNYNDNINLKNSLLKFNDMFFNNKIKMIDFTSEWDKGLFFDTNNDSYNYIYFYLNNSIDTIQKNAFWFIDINNYYTDDDCCFNAFIRFMWKAIQKEIDYLGLNIDIGLFDKNNNSYICKKYKEIIMKYHNDLDENKKSLYNNINRDKIQDIFNTIFSYININEKKNKTNNNYNTFRNNDNFNNIYNDNNNVNNNNISYNTSRNKDYNYDYNNNISRKKENDNNENNIQINENQNNLKKVKILCVTWNIAGIDYKSDYNITELFTQNIFYHKKAAPDIIVVAIQEIIKLSITSVLSLVSNQENVKAWTDNILYTIAKVFPETKYYQLKCMDLVGIYILVLTKRELKDNIYILDSNTTKTGVYGTMGNKGFFTVTLKCFDNLISFGSGHFEAGQSKNEERIDTLNQLLNKPININNNDYLTFKDVEYWIILGDLNFRIDLNYEDAYVLIREKKYNVLYSLDQFNSALQIDKFLKDFINEKEINFDPTYKYVKFSNEYAYDEDKIRVPAWTDRIFYCKSSGIKMLTYDSIKNIKYSDHRPVVGTFLIKCMNKKSKSMKKIKNKIENPYENIFEKGKEKVKSNKNVNSNVGDLIEIDNNIIQNIKQNNNYGENNNMKENKKNKSGNYKSKSTKNVQQIKMNYRGINFDTEIDKNIHERDNKQDIYQFFVDRQKNNNYSNLNSNLFFGNNQNNNNNNISQNQNLLFGSFNNNIINDNQDIFINLNQNNFNNNNQNNNINFNNNNNSINNINNNNYQNNNNNFIDSNNILNFFQ